MASPEEFEFMWWPEPTMCDHSLNDEEHHGGGDHNRCGNGDEQVITNISVDELNSFESSTGHLAEPLTSPELSALQPLINSLDSMFNSPEEFYSDAKLVLANGQEVSFHRCVLSARIPLFKRALATADQMHALKLELKEIAGDYEVGFDSVMTVLAYVYNNTVRLPSKEISKCLDKDCYHVLCRPAVDFMVEVLYLAFVFHIPELVTLYQSCLLNIVDEIRVEDIVVLLKLANICGQACKNLFASCTKIIARSDVDVVSLNKSLPSSNQQIVKQITNIRKELGLETLEPEKYVLSMYQALELGDIELVKMFLTEGHTLDGVYALHYAVAYCDVKTTVNLLDLDLADVNRRNPRGYTVLHVAAMRKEPELIMYLLTKGASASVITFDGRTARLIAKQLTKEADYRNISEQRKPYLKSRLCIEILEQAHKRDSWHVEASPSLVLDADELRTRLLFLERKVVTVQSLFPMEAQIAMDICHVERTRKFTAEDLFIAHFTIQEEHRSRLTALARSVELVSCFFSWASVVLNSLTGLEEDLSDLPCAAEEDTLKQQKKERLMELQESLMGEIGKLPIAASSSSSSTSTSTAAAMRSGGKRSRQRR